jgi:hypothetical protein
MPKIPKTHATEQFSICGAANSPRGDDHIRPLKNSGISGLSSDGAGQDKSKTSDHDCPDPDEPVRHASVRNDVVTQRHTRLNRTATGSRQSWLHRAENKRPARGAGPSRYSKGENGHIDYRYHGKFVTSHRKQKAPGRLSSLAHSGAGHNLGGLDSAPPFLKYRIGAKS